MLIKVDLNFFFKRIYRVQNILNILESSRKHNSSSATVFLMTENPGHFSSHSNMVNWISTKLLTAFLTSVQHGSIVVDCGGDQLVGWWWVGLVGHIVVDKGRDQLVGWVGRTPFDTITSWSGNN